MVRPSREAVLVYGAALVLGVALMLWTMPLPAIMGVGPGWNPPMPDQAQALSGHLAFQADAWRWPLLETRTLFWPHGISLALVDSNALVSLLAKLWAKATGQAPANWLGAFVAACFLLQPVSAAYAARGLRVGPVAALAAAVLAGCWPALMFRMMHINLCGHFLLLFALGLAFRGLERPRGWAAPWLLLLASILIHPYLFQLCAAVLAAIPLQAVLRRREGWQRELGLYLLAGSTSVGLLVLIAGPLGGGDKGFAFFSMNLLSPIWPQLSGVFGPALPILDGTGGQYEGYNWLGAGTLLLVLAGLGRAAWQRRLPRPALGLVLVLAALALISLGSRIYAGPLKLADLGTKPWEDIFGSFRAAGRAFWPVGYAIMLGGVAMAARLPRLPAALLLAAAAALQIVDVGPVRARAHLGWAQGGGITVPAVPAGTTLFTVAPHPGCTPDAATKIGAPVMILDAVRIGARAGDIGLGRSPSWFNCEKIVSDALELPLLPHETRAFFGEPVQTALRPPLFGAGAVCRRTVPPGGSWVPPGAPPAAPIILCGVDIADIPGEPVLAAPAPAPVTLPLEAGPDALEPLLGFGWRLGLTGGAWSEGPRSTLVIPVPTGRPLELQLRASGIAVRAGDVRVVRVVSGRLPVGEFTLSDGLATTVRVAIPASTIATGILRLSLDVLRPIDPRLRGITAPVQRAAIRLAGISLRIE